MKTRAATTDSGDSGEAPPMEELLAALRAAGEGDASIRLTPDGPGIMKAIADAFNVLMERCGEARPRHEAAQFDELQAALRLVTRGDFAVRLPADRHGLLGETYRDFNQLVTLNERFATEIDRLGNAIGQEGRLTERASLGAVSGAWESSIDTLNTLVSDLAQPTTEVSRVITAVAEGDLTQTMSLELNGRPIKGEFLRIGTTVNTMVDQLSRFADEVTRVAREVGSEGKLGGQAHVKGVAGT